MVVKESARSQAELQNQLPEEMARLFVFLMLPYLPASHDVPRGISILLPLSASVDESFSTSSPSNAGYVRQFWGLEQFYIDARSAQTSSARTSVCVSAHHWRIRSLRKSL